MFKNAQSNAEPKSVDVELLIIKHTQMNLAPRWALCAQRAHSWNDLYKSYTHHIEMILPEEEQIAPKPQDEIAQKKNMSQKKVKNKNLWPRNKFSIK